MHVQVAMIGEPVDLTYNYAHLGNSAADIKAAAKSAFVKAMKAGEKPMIIVGPGVLQRTDAKAVLKSIYSLTAAAGALRNRGAQNCGQSVHRFRSTTDKVKESKSPQRQTPARTKECTYTCIVRHSHATHLCVLFSRNQGQSSCERRVANGSPPQDPQVHHNLREAAGSTNI